MIADGELAQMHYGPSTARAVLDYKTERRISVLLEPRPAAGSTINWAMTQKPTCHYPLAPVVC